MILKRLLTFIIMIFLVIPLIMAYDTSNDVMYYSFNNDDTSGGLCLDSTPNNNDCSLNAFVTTGATGKIGESYDFESSSSSYIDFDGIGPWLGNDFKISVWIKQESLGDGDWILSVGDETFAQKEAGFRFSGTGVQCITFNRDGNEINSVVADSSFTNNHTWVHLAMNVGSTSHINNCWINGIDKGSSSSYSFGLGGSESGVLGAFIWDSPSRLAFYDGLLDELLIGNGTFSQSDIDELYNIGIGFNPYDASEPVLSNYNVTSDNVISEINRSNWNNGLSVGLFSDLLTGTFDTDIISNCSISLYDLNYTGMVSLDSNYKMATTETTNHAFTLSDDLIGGKDCVYVSCISSIGLESASSSSGCLDIELFLPPSHQGWTQPANNTNVSGYSNVLWNVFSDVNNDMSYYNLSLNYPNNGSEAYALGSAIFGVNSKLINWGLYDIGYYDLFIKGYDYYGLSDNLSLRIGVESGDFSVTNINPLNNSLNVGFDVAFSWVTSKNANCSLFLNNTKNVSVYNIKDVIYNYDIHFTKNNSYKWFVNCTGVYGVNSFSDPFFFKVQQEPYVAPVVYAFSVGSCPNDSLVDVAVMFLFIIIGLILLIVAFAYDVNILGVMASLFLFGVSLIIVGCSQFLGLTLVFIFSVLGIVFIIRSIV